MFLLADLLAAASPPPSPITEDQARLLIYVSMAVVVVASISAIGGVLRIIAFFRPDPPNDARYASVNDLKALAASLKEQEARHQREMAAINAGIKEVFQELRGINRTLGRLEATDHHHD